MTWYLVRAKPKTGKLVKLKRKIELGDISIMKPFGAALDRSLKNARATADGYAVWEEEDYCSPPLAQERKAILNEFFRELTVEAVPEGQGWKRIGDLPSLWR